MLTDVPTGPVVGERLVMAGVTVKFTPLLARPAKVTTMLPVVAPEGTGTIMLVLLTLVGAATVPLKVTVPVVPKSVPLIVTAVPTGPETGETLVMFGGRKNGTPLVAKPETVTIRLPVVAPAGTGTMMLVSLQLVGVANVPLKVTVLVP